MTSLKTNTASVSTMRGEVLYVSGSTVLLLRVAASQRGCPRDPSIEGVILHKTTQPGRTSMMQCTNFPGSFDIISGFQPQSSAENMLGPRAAPQPVSRSRGSSLPSSLLPFNTSISNNTVLCRYNPKVTTTSC